jgi:hypothetical protein
MNSDSVGAGVSENQCAVCSAELLQRNKKILSVTKLEQGLQGEAQDRDSFLRDKLF